MLLPGTGPTPPVTTRTGDPAVCTSITLNCLTDFTNLAPTRLHQGDLIRHESQRLLLVGVRHHIGSPDLADLEAVQPTTGGVDLRGVRSGVRPPTAQLNKEVHSDSILTLAP